MADEAIKVLDLATGDERTYVGLTVEEAVIAAHAQSRGDYSTWEYAGRYSGLVRHGTACTSCGDMTALTDRQSGATT